MLMEESRIEEPSRPADQAEAAVAGWREPIAIDTYLPEAPDRYPAYLDHRVYQGSSGKVYPLPFFERINPVKRSVEWDAVHLENAWLRLMILPALGGRIHIGRDRATGYDFFYRNNVIKPALIGLTGPWIAGGVEFNWPQHHRPATYLPTDVSIERSADGSVTVWCSDHDPFTRMKGMHGVCLHPDRSVVELKVRLYNSSEEPQTFLWWANVAARAHHDYQSFFPTDVTMVADHAKRAVTAFPTADRPYYGIDYPLRPGADRIDPSVKSDRIDWYRNIPVPTSYMCMASLDDFFGGYDHAARAGFVHVADHQISVGKKQWTWGNEEFGRAWCANLTDDGSAYVELMAGVFTDNQPDFSFIAPGETKVFSQFWYPISAIGPVQQATPEAAVAVEVAPDAVTVGVVSTSVRPGSMIEVRTGDWAEESAVDLAPGAPVTRQICLPPGAGVDDLTIVVRHADTELVTWSPRQPASRTAAAVEPEPPKLVSSVEELYLTGVHLEQQRHATRAAEPYWLEALRRDPGHAQTNTALAVRHYRAGQYADAEPLLRTAVARLTRLNPNPSDTTAHYYLGLVLRRLGRPAEAYDAFGKALWNRAWRPAAGFQLACLDAAAGRDRDALARLDDVARTEPDHLQAASLRVILLRRLGQPEQAEVELRAILAGDPLHWWSLDLAGNPLTCDAQTCLDVALEYARVGETEAALRVLEVAWDAEVDPASGASAARPLIGYYQSRLLASLGRHDESNAAARRARTVSDRYCFPGRLDDADLLREMSDRFPDDARPPALLGHWLYAVGRHDEAVAYWRTAVRHEPGNAVVWRNLGLAAFNHAQDVGEAIRCYEKAVSAAPDDGRLRFERDQLDARAGVEPAVRLKRMGTALVLVLGRDDATVELANLLISVGEADRAAAILLKRDFQPWEGGEGQVLRAWDRACSALARQAILDEDDVTALTWLDRALDPPRSLGEQRHPLANPAELHLLRGDALAASGDLSAAREAWTRAASHVGDFISMSAEPFSDSTYFSILAHRRLGHEQDASGLTRGLAAYCDRLEQTPAAVDYFATSLPTLLLFAEDPELAKSRRVQTLRGQLARLQAQPDPDATHLVTPAGSQVRR